MTLQQVFFNSAGRLRSGWRFLIFVLLYGALQVLVTTLIRGAYVVVLESAPRMIPRPALQDLIFRFSLLATALVAGYICARVLEGLPWRSLGVSLHKHWFRDLLVGSVIGVASLALATAIAAAGAGLSFTITPRDLAGLVIRTLLGSMVIFIIAALAEEALFRGYPLQTFTRAQLAWVGILVTSLPFLAAHLENPNTALLASINTGLAGVWLAVAYLRTRSLWFPLGVHWAWNWALGSLFGLPVSGITRLAPHPVLQGTDLGPAWLTGGNYGIEGGIAATIALVVSTLFIWRTRLVGPTEEMWKLTSKENPAAKPISVVDTTVSP